MKISATTRALWHKASQGALTTADRAQLRDDVKPFPKLGKLLPYMPAPFVGIEKYKIQKLAQNSGEIPAGEVHEVIRLLERIFQHEPAPSTSSASDNGGDDESDTPHAILIDRRIRELEAAEREIRAAGSHAAGDHVRRKIVALRRELDDLLPEK